MKNQKREILKRIAHGSISDKEATNLLKRTEQGFNPVIFVFEQEDGSFIIDDERNLTKDQVDERVKGFMYAIVPEKARRLGEAIPEN